MVWIIKARLFRFSWLIILHLRMFLPHQPQALHFHSPEPPRPGKMVKVTIKWNKNVRTAVLLHGIDRMGLQHHTQADRPTARSDRRPPMRLT